MAARADNVRLRVFAFALAVGPLALHAAHRVPSALPLRRAAAPAVCRAAMTSSAPPPPPPPPPAYEDLTGLLREISTLNGALGILGWDEQTVMPPGAARARGAQKAALAGVIHEKATAPALGAAIAACAAALDALPDAAARANVRDARRGYEHTTRVSKALAMEREEAETAGYAAWTAAREADDWAAFAPTMENGLRVMREYATTTRPGMDPYDAAIDMYERGMTAARLADVFGALGPPLKALLERVVAARAAAPPVADLLKGGDHWDVDAQARLCRALAARLTFDFARGMVGTSPHPFTGGAGAEDTRITTRYSKDVPWEGIMGTVHEVGHALYEQGRNPAQDGLPAAEPLSMGAHESQSLFWERMVAQSPPFWKAVLPLVRAELPFADALSAGDFAHAVNQVRPEGLIRVDADELSYPFHIILRFEIERGLFDGTITVADLPTVWNAKMREYFGVDVPSDAAGVLQDVHWPSLMFGYFPSYTLGAMAAAQLYAFMDKTAMPGMGERIARGEFAEIKTWLNRHFHVHGSVYPTLDELLVRVTGEPLSPKHYVDYLTAKYSAMYGL
jgi:carboxypeptidase Taq